MTLVVLNTMKRIKSALIIFISMAVINGVICFLGAGFTLNEIYEIAKYKIKVFYGLDGTFRGKGFAHPLQTAYYLSLAGTLSFGFACITKSRIKIVFFLLISFFLLSAEMSTLSKGPFIALFTGTMVIIFNKDSIKKRFISILGIIIISVIFSFIISRIVINKSFSDVQKAFDYTAKTTTQASGEKSSLGSRIIRWKTGIYILYNTYGFGAGAGGFYSYIEPHQRFDNIYMQILSEFGFIGLWLFLWFIVESIRRYIKAYAICNSITIKNWLLVISATCVTTLVNGLTALTVDDFISIFFIFGIGHSIVNIIDEYN